MNINKNILLSAFAALSLGSASASVTYVTGSTAFQSTADKALSNFVTANGGGIVASDGAFGSEVDILLNYGTPATNYIVAHWSGSEAGIQAIDSPSNNPVRVKFFATNVTGGVNGASSSLATNPELAQVAYSDTFYVSSLFRPGAHAGDGRTYGTPSKDYTLCGQGFSFFGSSNIPIVNITSQNIRQLYAASYISLSLITGNSADMTNAVFPVGRNIDSGTRIQAMAESGVGANSQVNQVQVTNGTVVAYPGDIVDGIVVATGNNGYSSTGTLLGALEAVYQTGTSFDPQGLAGGDNTGSNFIVGYAAASKIGTAGTVALAYNGVPWSTANMTNGLYTFWGYEHIDVSPFYADSAASNVASSMNTFVTGLTTAQLGSGNASLTDMSNVTRSADGGVVSQNF